MTSIQGIVSDFMEHYPGGPSQCNKGRIKNRLWIEILRNSKLLVVWVWYDYLWQLTKKAVKTIIQQKHMSNYSHNTSCMILKHDRKYNCVYNSNTNAWNSYINSAPKVQVYVNKKFWKP
jgi:hypothetical protein